jgi:hypothetical protein
MMKRKMQKKSSTNQRNVLTLQAYLFLGLRDREGNPRVIYKTDFADREGCLPTERSGVMPV